MNDIYLLDLIGGISIALDYVSPTVTGHHRRVGVGAALLGKHMGMGVRDVTDLLLAGLLHDIGAFSLNIPLDRLSFDSDLIEHATVGYRLLRGYPLLERPARMVLHHHTLWSEVQQEEHANLLSNVINLADQMDRLAQIGTTTLGRQKIRTVIADSSGTTHAPEVAEAFMDVSTDNSFWERVDDPDTPLREMMGDNVTDLLIPNHQLLDFSNFFAHIIDFRSRHTATHSRGVAETAVQLATLAGMNEDEQQQIRLARNLHDIGKLAVSSTLLDKPARLNDEEYKAIRNHAVVCEKVLRSIPGMEDITDWASQHHERLNGKGYPHGLTGTDLSQGSRIVAVADVHTAITDDRPYRVGMNRDKAASLLLSLSKEGSLDSEIVELVLENHEQIDEIRRIVQNRALAEFKQFSNA